MDLLGIYKQLFWFISFKIMHPLQVSSCFSCTFQMHLYIYNKNIYWTPMVNGYLVNVCIENIFFYGI